MPETDIVVTSAEDLTKLAAGEPAEGAEPAPKQDAPDVPKGAETPTESETVEPKEEKGEKKGGWQKRIDKLTAEKYRLEQELSEFRSKAAKPPEQAPPAEEKPKGKPERAAYQTDQEFFEALTDWKYDQRTAQEKQQREQMEQNDRARVVMDAHFERIGKAYEEIPDFEEHLAQAKVGIPQAAAIAIYECEEGPKIMDFLAIHQDEAEKLHEMSPARQIAYVERLALKISPETVPATETPVSKAPPPIKPVGASATRTAADEDSLTDDEWIAKRNKETKGRRKG